MKSFRIVWIVICCVVLLASCTFNQGHPLPSSSANFDETFFEKFDAEYFVYDEQLIDISLVPWEAERILSAENEDHYALRFAMVENYPNKEFVSVTEVREAYRGMVPISSGCDLRTMVYQNTDSSPIRDWDIAEISVVWAWSHYTNLDERDWDEVDLPRTESLLAQKEDDCQILYTFYKEDETKDEDSGDNEKRMIELVQKACKQAEIHSDSSLKGMDITVRKMTLNVEGLTAKKDGMLLIRFEQCSQVVWLGSLYVEGENLYLKCPYTDEKGVHAYGFILLPEQCTKEILKVFEENNISIHNYDLPESQSNQNG